MDLFISTPRDPRSINVKHFQRAAASLVPLARVRLGSQPDSRARPACWLPCPPKLTKVQLPNLYLCNLDKTSCCAILENGSPRRPPGYVSSTAPQSGSGVRSLFENLSPPTRVRVAIALRPGLTKSLSLKTIR